MKSRSKCTPKINGRLECKIVERLTSPATDVANLDLFMKLDQGIEAIERERDIKIGFWHVSREYNTIADRLATAAALGAPPAPPIRSPG